jgi:hypothetical protein
MSGSVPCRVPKEFLPVLAKRGLIRVSPVRRIWPWAVLFAGSERADVVFASSSLALKFSYDRILEVRVASRPSSTDWISLRLMLDYVTRRPLFGREAQAINCAELAGRLDQEYEQVIEAASGVEGQRTRSAINEAWREWQESLRGANKPLQPIARDDARSG